MCCQLDWLACESVFDTFWAPEVLVFANCFVIHGELLIHSISLEVRPLIFTSWAAAIVTLDNDDDDDVEMKNVEELLRIQQPPKKFNFSHSALNFKQNAAKNIQRTRNQFFFQHLV